MFLCFSLMTSQNLSKNKSPSLLQPKSQGWRVVWKSRLLGQQCNISWTSMNMTASRATQVPSGRSWQWPPCPCAQEPSPLQDTQGPPLLWPQTAPELPPKAALPSGTRLRPNPGKALARGGPPVLPARPAGCSLQTPPERGWLWPPPCSSLIVHPALAGLGCRVLRPWRISVSVPGPWARCSHHRRLAPTAAYPLCAAPRISPEHEGLSTFVPLVCRGAPTA